MLSSSRRRKARVRALACAAGLAKGTCGYGRQEAHSSGPFAITVWGIGAWASYGYVGGTGLRPINDLPAPVLK